MPDRWWHATCNLDPYTIGVGGQLWRPGMANTYETASERTKLVVYKDSFDDPDALTVIAARANPQHDARPRPFDSAPCSQALARETRRSPSGYRFALQIGRALPPPASDAPLAVMMMVVALVMIVAVPCCCALRRTYQW